MHDSRLQWTEYSQLVSDLQQSKSAVVAAHPYRLAIERKLRRFMQVLIVL
jgi:hypothetical protein